MSVVRDIKLEFLRSGLAHNQLLSPLTTYLALCGADGPVGVNLPFEHAQLLTRLNRLRYEIDGVPVAASQREAELRELGETIARTLGTIPALVSELRSARTDTNRLVNVRLAISGYELGLVPFEATMAPADSSGSSAPLLLGTRTNITREIRRGEPLKVEWNRPPKILFAFASPAGLPMVPAQDHLEALRAAVEPWIAIKDKDKPKERLADVRKMLTVLNNATLGKISDLCESEDFTHVHILAHGAPLPRSDNRRFGVVLCRDDDPAGQAVTDGESLAMALKGLRSDGRVKQPPTVVTLMTCDSGNAGTVLTPGGSIAHELHAQDIPWVIASQFPLWMRASSLAAKILYRGLLDGNDPRWVLHRLRRELRKEMPDTHDWASIVAYAAVAPDLEQQVDEFRSRQTKARINVKFDRMDALVGVNEPDLKKRQECDRNKVRPELDALRESIRADLSTWSDEAAAQNDVRQRAERLGMWAASEKRIAIIYALFNDDDESLKAYRKSLQLYNDAVRSEPNNHWAITQYLSIAATPKLTSDSQIESLRVREGLWLVAQQLANWQLEGAQGIDRAWAHSTLAELELLGVLYRGGTAKEAVDRVVNHCKEIARLSAQYPFALQSTQRQFRRYLDYWPREQWKELAEAAIKALDAGAAR